MTKQDAIAQDAIPRGTEPRVGEMVQVPFGRRHAMATVWEVYGTSRYRFAYIEQHLHGPRDPADPYLATVPLPGVLPLRLMSEEQILEHLRYHRPRSRRDEWDWWPKQELYEELKRRKLNESEIDELVFDGRQGRR